jgi:hypothetical protein
LVEGGKLPTVDTDDADEVMLTLLGSAPPRVQSGLSSEAEEILLRAVHAKGPDQGTVLMVLHSEGLTIKMGDTPRTFSHDDRRTQARYKRAVDELVQAGLLEHLSESVLDVTDAGYLAADEIMVSRGQS